MAGRTRLESAGAEGPARTGSGLGYRTERTAAAEERLPGGGSAAAAYEPEDGFDDTGFTGEEAEGPVRIQPPITLSAVQDGTIGELQRRLSAAPVFSYVPCRQHISHIRIPPGLEGEIVRGPVRHPLQLIIHNL